MRIGFSSLSRTRQPGAGTTPIHEAGHALVAGLLGLEVTGLTAAAEGRRLGACTVRFDTRGPEVPTLIALITTALAGKAAELLVFGDLGRWSTDEAHALDLAMSLSAISGGSPESILQRCGRSATDLLRANRARLLVMASEIA